MKRGASNKAQRSIQSIEVGFRLIEILKRSGRQMSLKTLAEAAGMPSAKAHLYLVSFNRIGLTIQDPESLRYGLGPYAVGLGLAALDQLDVVSLARQPLEALHKKLNLSVFLSVWGNRGPTIVQKLDPQSSLPVYLRVGYVLPLIWSATGQNFLAFLPEMETRKILAQEVGQSKELQDRARSIRKTVRRVGFAAARNQQHEGFGAMAAPIFSHEGAILATLTAVGAVPEAKAASGRAVIDAVRASASEVSRLLGAKGDA